MEVQFCQYINLYTKLSISLFGVKYLHLSYLTDFEIPEGLLLK